ncbi:WhiB family transcriptional regulator [Actinospongicola halichondriae]|uniref:WhiB family transcriptional regulator n=1 Tax=Actinospongicola halichondriae TaxID=3236844 RepID=UPI003D42C402
MESQYACVGYGSLFFAPVAERPQARVRREGKARQLCLRCDSRIHCRDVARANREFGFWGGENEEERTLAGFAVPNPIGARRRAS